MIISASLSSVRNVMVINSYLLGVVYGTAPQIQVFYTSTNVRVVVLFGMALNLTEMTANPVSNGLNAPGE